MYIRVAIRGNFKGDGNGLRSSEPFSNTLKSLFIRQYSTSKSFDLKFIDAFTLCKTLETQFLKVMNNTCNCFRALFFACSNQLFSNRKNLWVRKLTVTNFDFINNVSFSSYIWCVCGVALFHFVLSYLPLVNPSQRERLRG